MRREGTQSSQYGFSETPHPARVMFPTDNSTLGCFGESAYVPATALQPNGLRFSADAIFPSRHSTLGCAGPVREIRSVAFADIKNRPVFKSNP